MRFQYVMVLSLSFFHEAKLQVICFSVWGQVVANLKGKTSWDSFNNIVGLNCWDLLFTWVGLNEKFLGFARRGWLEPNDIDF